MNTEKWKWVAGAARVKSAQVVVYHPAREEVFALHKPRNSVAESADDPRARLEITDTGGAVFSIECGVSFVDQHVAAAQAFARYRPAATRSGGAG